MSGKRDFDLVLWGATGFTGRLVAEHLLGRQGATGDLCWAMAGRSIERLETVRAQLGDGAEDLPLLIADSGDPGSLETLAKRTRVVCSTVGPYARHGSHLVAACARSGTDYCDITGEVQWVRRMIDAWEDTARQEGARLLHCCGFDSIPSDLGCLFAQAAYRERFGAPADEVKLFVRKIRGQFSGGTYASLLNALAEARSDPEARRALGHPYGLNPRDAQSGPDGPDQRTPAYDEDMNAWTAPFVMAPVNTRVVRRTNAISGFPYGSDFRYGESVLTGSGPAGWARAAGMTAALAAFITAVATRPAREAIQRMFLPEPGEGPSREQQNRGFFDIRLVARSASGDQRVTVKVTADRDPGYGATSRMLGEAALALAAGEALVDGGSWTPAAALGAGLIDRLRGYAGMAFEEVPS
jgi:short subunit dehydrogenase-like uncharacterized protein